MATQSVDKRRRKDRRVADRRSLPRRRTEFWATIGKNATKIGAVLGALVWGYYEVHSSYERYTVNRELVEKVEAERAKRSVDERIRWLEEQVIEMRAQKKSP